MKKILFVLILALPFVFNSCSDDKDGTTLSGTTWEYYKDFGEGFIIKMTYKFTEKTFSYAGFSQLASEKVELSGSGTYTYNPPTVSFYYGDGEAVTATISGSKMTMDDDSGVVYTKK